MELLVGLLLALLVVTVGALVVVLVRLMRRWPVTSPSPVPPDPAGATSADPGGVTRWARGDTASAAGPAGGHVAPAPMAAVDDGEVAQLREEARADRARAAELAAGAAAEAQTVLERARRAAREEAERLRAEVGRIHAEVEQAAAEVEQSRTATEHASRTRAQELDQREELVEVREQRLTERARVLEDEAHQIETREHELARQEAEIARRRAELTDLEQERHRVLEQVAGLSAEQARAELVRQAEHQAKRDAALLVRDIESAAREEGEQRARKIVTLAIQRVASEQTAESVVSVLHLPSDDMKGRIIGREGRNIRAFEAVTGVNVLIDDTPEAVLLSCFDPVRREVGRLTLEALVLDGRIHPQRIEEQHERAKTEVDALCVRAGEDALVAVGITDMHPELIAVLGRLRYRTSYGQNVLKHLVESAHLAGVMAAELRLPPELAKRGTLLHDIGKALTHEVEGSHALVGAELARRYEEDEEVVHAIEAHHNEVEPRTIGAVLTQAADQISGGRPGARRESLESYVQRLERIEQIAAEKPGVDRVFAMQAGREVRVMVLPEAVDDIGAQVLARDVAKQIEDELTYPGQIRVTVVRETRSTEIAR